MCDEIKAKDMLEGFSETKNNENLPLLMVAGAGDAAVLAPSPLGAAVWSTTTTVRTRRPWSERWPEYLSSCWMTFILLGVSFIVFYAIGVLVIYRSESYGLLVKCNDTKPASDVYYHNLVPRGGAFPLMTYSSYLSTMAIQYPSLRFHVVLLIDDSKPCSPPRNFYNKFYPTAFYEELNMVNRREVREFQRRFNNVNFTVMSLSRFMAVTPFKYKWRTIPTDYLLFYARVWSVWSNAGIGLDLASQNELYQTRQLRPDRRTSAILKQHNDGIDAERYITTMNRLQREDESDMINTFFYMIQKMLNDTISIFNYTLPFASSAENNIPSEKTISRAKRDIPKEETDRVIIKDKIIYPQPIINIVLANTSVVNVTSDTSKENTYQLSLNNDTTSTTAARMSTDTKTEITNDNTNTELIVQKDTTNTEIQVDVTSDAKENKSESGRVVLFYDFSIVSEPIQPEIEPQRIVVSKRGIKSRALTYPPQFVTLESEGAFIAATSQKHPFLASIISAGCKRMHPRNAIKSALMCQCSGIFRDDTYCNSIYIF